MTVKMENNYRNNPDAELDVVVEEDEGIYLSVSATNTETAEPLFDYVATHPGDVEAFFEMVEQARVDWVRLNRGEH